jgi:hypothetical protein
MRLVGIFDSGRGPNTRRRPALKRLITIAATLALCVGGAGLVSADSRVIDFESYNPTSIQGQQGWGGQNPPVLPSIP